MAMSDEAIKRARGAAGTIGAKAASLQTAGESLGIILSKNGNYQYFKIGTDKGTSVDADLKKTIDGIVEVLVPSLQKVQDQIMHCCAAAEMENKIREQQAAKKLEDAPSTIIPNLAKGVTVGQQEIMKNYNGELNF